LAIVAAVFLLGTAALTEMQYRQERYMASPAQFAGAAVGVVLLAALAFLQRPVRLHGMISGAPSPWGMGAVTLLLASAALFVPMHWGWGAVAVLLGLDAAMLALALIWSRQGASGLRLQLALGAGAALAYGCHAFIQHPAVGSADASFRVGNAVFLAGAIAIIWFAARRIEHAGLSSNC
jgi:hypothetical protein